MVRIFKDLVIGTDEVIGIKKVKPNSGKQFEKEGWKRNKEIETVLRNVNITRALYDFLVTKDGSIMFRDGKHNGWGLDYVKKILNIGANLGTEYYEIYMRDDESPLIIYFMDIGLIGVIAPIIYHDVV